MQPWPALTDFGNILCTLPALHPACRIPSNHPKRQGDYTVSFTEVAETPEAHHLILQATTEIAVMGAKMIVESDFRDRVTRK